LSLQTDAEDIAAAVTCAAGATTGSDCKTEKEDCTAVLF